MPAKTKTKLINYHKIPLVLILDCRVYFILDRALLIHLWRGHKLAYIHTTLYLVCVKVMHC